MTYYIRDIIKLTRQSLEVLQYQLSWLHWAPQSMTTCCKVSTQVVAPPSNKNWQYLLHMFK